MSERMEELAEEHVKDDVCSDADKYNAKGDFRSGWIACEKEMEKLIPQLEFVKLQLEAKNARIDQLEGALKDIHVMLLTSTQVAFTRTDPEFTGECIVEAKKMIYSALYPEIREKALGSSCE